MSLLIVTLLLLCYAADHAPAQDAQRISLTHFETTIRPLLVEHCLKCHGRTKSEAGLRLDDISRAIKGGDSGPAITPGQPEKSLLVKAIRRDDGLAMPPSGKLDDHDIAMLVRWIKEGAAWPASQTLGDGKPELRGGPITAEERLFWSWQPIANVPPATVGATLLVRNDIDRFVLARLAVTGLTIRSEADKRTLLRRATFDLTGLPVTPAEYEAFLQDDSSNAFAKVVDRLLDSQACGERWGRHWLDVVRYADTAGETADYPTPLSYKYRNWVINAFNADKPYDQFIREQIAGDILGQQMVEHCRESADDETLARYRDMLTATGFIAIARRFGFDIEKWHTLTIQDTIDTVGQAVLGLTLGCARCHDHKYDPVTTEDYYGWYGIFESTRYSFPGSEQKKRPYDLLPVLPLPLAESIKAGFDQHLSQLEAEIKQLEADQKSLENQPVASTGGLETPTSTRLDAAAKRLAELISQRSVVKQSGPYELIYGASEGTDPRDARIQVRGDRLKLGDAVPRKNLEILGNDLLPEGAGSGRLELAYWLTRPSNPLTARVMVNRIWQHHFGRGIVATENDFGARGEPPTHPELLEWLASRFIECGWSVKAMHRLIMGSATYQQSSAHDARAAEMDPEARLLWRFNQRRLSAEEIRDAMLFVSGDLDHTKGGEHPFPAVESWNFTQHTPYYGAYETNGRSIYLMQQRLKKHPFLGLFDGADTNASTARRRLTTVPTQALYLMNNEFVHERATSLAKRLIEWSDSEEQCVSHAFVTALGRPACSEEVTEAIAFLSSYRNALAGASPEQNRLAAWSAFVRTLLTRNEFLFVD